MKIGDRMYHAIFGWCKVTHPVNFKNNTLVDLEADEIEYYIMGKGYVNHKKINGRNSLLTPVSELFKDEESVTSEFELKKMAINPKLIFWK